ncbi:MAG: PVC-type heme-binding CxxCH protein [Planctomyces sp.]|jgi:putative membrane-bound dehydrogenase-like protein
MMDSDVNSKGFQVLRALVCCLFLTAPAAAADLQLLFMGDNGHHRPAERFHELAPVLESRGIRMKYTDRMEDLTPEVLRQFDGLVLYANIDRIEDAQAQAVLDFVSGGKGFVPLHCATFCWRNNPQMVQLMGAQFQRHGGQVFGTQIAAPQHPIMQGFGGFTSWDETYIHHLHNEQNREVLEYRLEGEQAEGQDREPWTWTRTHGKGRVFYTAWGHDQRTWTNAGFSNLVERGIRWACGGDVSVVPAFTDRDAWSIPAMTELRKDVAPFEYVDVGPKIPNYTPGRQWGVQGAPRTTMQQPLSVEESMKHYVTPQGMSLRLYADEGSFVAKPISMNWDERGRLWICETVDYPNELGQNRDRIRICEDTDGDHVADRFTVFAEGLSIPTAIMIYRGGAVVQNATETIYLKDTDGDDKADLKKVLITGWGAGDTHGGVSNFRYGLDNWIWSMQGYNDSSPQYGPEGAKKAADSFRQGFWRFRLSNTDPPEVTDLEFVRSTNNNTWGLGISEEGLIFGSTANHNPSTFMPIANRYYEKVRGWAASDIGTIADTHLFKPVTENVRQVDQFGGYTAGAGHALYTARTFPQQWWNRTAFVCEPTGHLVGTFVLRRDGTGYKSTSPNNLIASDDEWASPIMAEVGPDGAVWVIDWYNYIIQHNPTPQGFKTGRGNAYESDLRDQKRGRIYRVVPTGVVAGGGATDVLHGWQSLAGLNVLQLVDVLRHPSMMWRLQAQRLLVERADVSAVPHLVQLVSDAGVDEVGLNVGAIHALWVLQSLQPDGEGWLQAAVGALGHSSAGVRRNALAVLSQFPAGQEQLLRAGALTKDADAQVRLQGLLSLAEMPAAVEAGRLVAAAVLRPNVDLWESDAVTCAAAVQALPFLKALSADESAAGAPLSAAAVRTAAIVSEHIARGRPSVEQMQELLSGLKSAPPQLAEVVVRGLAEGWPKDHRIVATKELESGLTALLERVPAGGRGKLLQLASLCGSRALESYAKEIIDSLLKVVADGAVGTEERVNAAREAVSFQSDNVEILTAVLSAITPTAAPELSVGLIDAAALSTSEGLGAALIERGSVLTPQAKSAVVRVLLSRPATTTAMLGAFESGAMDLGELTLDQKQALRAHPDRGIRAAAEKLMAAGGGLPDADRDRVLKSLLSLCEQQGDVKAGRAMYVKHCSKCHMHGSEGKAIGPNLTGMAVHPKHELLTHIIDPSRSVEGNFRIYTVVKTDGVVLNGMMSGESRTAITLIDAEGRENQIAREDIEELVRSRKSLMPEGFEKQMNAEELTNLLEFLTDKGKFLPVSLDRYATAVSTKGLFSNDDNGPDRMVFGDWAPKIFKDVPFLLTDPRGKSVPNIILLNGPFGPLPPTMPKSVTLPLNSDAKAIHMLSGVGGWSFPYSQEKSVSVIVRLHYKGGEQEDIKLLNGVHFADYIRRVDVPGSEFAYMLGGQQIRRVTVNPSRREVIEKLELVKGPDSTAPIIMAVTVERN